MISTTTFPEFTDRPKDTAKTISGQTIDETVQAAIAEVSKSLPRIHPKSEEEVILQLLVRSGAISRSLFEAWYSASQANSMIAPKYLEIAMLAARSPNTTPEILAYLAMIDIGAWIELYPNAPFAMLEKYALIANLKLKIAIASNPNTPAKILEDFAREYTAIEQFVERLGSSVMDACDRASSLIEVSPEISEKLIANQFSSDEEYYKYIMELLYIVASHPHTPAKVLASMEWYTRKNDSGSTRGQAIVLINPSQPREYTQIRRGAIANPNFPQNLLEQIFRAGADVVWGHDDAWHYCIKNPQLSMECIKDLVTYKPMWRAEMADHPNMPFAILEMSAQSFNPNEKFKVVRNPALPARLIRQFVKDTDTYLVLADNPMVDAEVLTTITNYMCNVYPLQQDTKRSLESI